MPAVDRKFVVSRPRPERPIDTGRGVYGISVAAELVGTTPRNLRHYEAQGLLSPARTAGGTRRDNNDDLDRLRNIGHLIDRGLNLAGVAGVLELQAANRDLQPRSTNTGRARTAADRRRRRR